MPPAKRRRVTVTASKLGIDRAEKALLRLGFSSKSNFAKTRLMSKSTVDKFFNRQPIQLDSFRKICEELNLEDWRNIAELEHLIDQQALEDSEKVAELDIVEAVASQPINAKSSVARQITVTDRINGEVRFEIVLKGDIASIDDQFQKTLETILRSLSGHTITITDIQAGSIRIKVQGSPKDAAKLIDRLNSGKVTEITGFPVEGIQILSQDFLKETEENGSDSKWDLVREIIDHPVPLRRLISVDLSDTDLSGADLSDAILSGAILSDADLTNANLRSANLVDTDLSDAILSGADLSGADLSSADLRFANLSSADLSGGNFRNADLRLTNLSSADLRFANLRNADLRLTNLSGADLSSADLRFANLSSADLKNADLSGADLKNADLRLTNLSATVINNKTQFTDKWYLVWRIVNEGIEGANLSGVDLSGADLRGANFRNVNLSSANLSGADLGGADLTGACLENWFIDSNTNLQEITCQYFFFQFDQDLCQFTGRCPHDPNQFFVPGEFSELYQTPLKTIDIIYNDVIDWKAFLAALEELQSHYDDEIFVRSIGKKRVKLQVPPDSNLVAIARTLAEQYKSNLRMAEVHWLADIK